MKDIPNELVLNWDQTATTIIPSASWTIEKSGTKRVEIAGVDDKCQITAMFACSLSGDFLPIQLILKGTTKKCLPCNIALPKDGHVTCTAITGPTMI